MIGGGTHERLVIQVTADDPMQHHDVCGAEFSGPLREVEQSPVGAFLEPVAAKKLRGVRVVRGRELDVHRPIGTGAEQLELDRTDSTADLQHCFPLHPTPLHELDDPPGIAVEALPVVAASIATGGPLSEELVAASRGTTPHPSVASTVAWDQATPTPARLETSRRGGGRRPCSVGG